MRTALALVLVILIALAFFNPEMEQFRTFVEAQSERILLQETGEGRLGRFFSGVGSALAGSYVDRITERDNYVFFSVYTIDLDGPEQEENEWRFLGLGNQFIELERPEALRDRENGTR